MSMNIFSDEDFPLTRDLLDRLSQLTGKIMSADDVAQLRDMAISLDDARKGIWKVLNSLPVAVYVADAESKAVFVNNAYFMLTGITPEEIIGQSTCEIEKQGHLFTGSITTEVLRRKERVCSVAVLLKGGMNIPAITLGCPIFNRDGDLLYCVTVILNTAITNSFTYHPQGDLYSGEQVFAQKFNISPRELELINLMFFGFTYEQAAAKLFISINTIRAHMRNIYRKTDTQNLGSLLQLYKDFKCFNLLYFPDGAPPTEQTSAK